MQALATNILANSEHYSTILEKYNEELKENGKVNNKKFYEEVIHPLLPDYHMQSWYKFLRRFKGNDGLEIATVAHIDGPIENGPPAQQNLAMTILSNQQATAKLVAGLLNVSADAAAAIMANPNLLSPKERVELGIKIMKAQDSRIHAVGKIREDTREQEKFDRAFDDAAYGDGE